MLSDVFRLHGVQVCDKEVSVNLFNSKSRTSQMVQMCTQESRAFFLSLPILLSHPSFSFRAHYTTPQHIAHPCFPPGSLRDLRFFALCTHANTRVSFMCVSFISPRYLSSLSSVDAQTGLSLAASTCSVSARHYATSPSTTVASSVTGRWTYQGGSSGGPRLRRSVLARATPSWGSLPMRRQHRAYTAFSPMYGYEFRLRHYHWYPWYHTGS